MGIRAYTGLPGSGKTFRIVSDLLELQATKKARYVIHNVESLNPDKFKNGKLVQLDKHLKDNGISLDQFFQKDYQAFICEEVKKEYDLQVLVILDEAQNLLDSRAAFEWLTWHRHLDQDVWLGTQNLRNVDRHVRNLIEYEIRGKKGPIIPFFIYAHRSEGSVFSWSYKMKNRSVFKAYKSFDLGSGKTGSKSPWMFAFLLLFLGLVGYTVYLKGNLFNHGELAKKSSEAKPKVEAKVTETKPKDLINKDRYKKEDKKPLQYKLTDSGGFIFAGKMRDRFLLFDGKVTGYVEDFLPGSFVFSVDPARRVLTVVTARNEVKRFYNELIENNVDQVEGVTGQVRTERKVSSMWVWYDAPKGYVAPVTGSAARRTPGDPAPGAKGTDKVPSNENDKKVVRAENISLL